jgi:hypothetical protein
MGIEGIKQGVRLSEGRYQAVSKRLTPETETLNIQVLKKYRTDITPAEAAKLTAADEAEGHYHLPHVVHHHSDGFDHSRDQDPREWAHAQTPEIEAYDAHTAERITYQNERQVLVDYRWDDGSPVPGAKGAAAKLLAKQRLPEPKHAWLSVEIDGTSEQHRVWVQDLSELSKQHYNSYRAYEPIRASTQQDEGIVRKLTPQEKKELAEAKKRVRALEEARREQLEQDALEVGVPEDITLSEYQALNQEQDLDLKWTALERNCPPELLGFIKEERRERRNLLAREGRRNAKRLLAPATWEDTIRAGL